MRASQLPRLFECPSSGAWEEVPSENLSASYGTVMHALAAGVKMGTALSLAAPQFRTKVSEMVAKKLDKSGVRPTAIYPAGGMLEYGLAWNKVTLECTGRPHDPTDPAAVDEWKRSMGPEWLTGTADYLRLDSGHLVLLDLKTGSKPPTLFSEQLLFYLNAAARCYGRDVVKTMDVGIIHWPYYKLADGPKTHTRTVTWDELDGFVERLKWTIAQVPAPGGLTTSPDEFIPGEWCRWCPGLWKCPVSDEVHNLNNIRKRDV